MCSLGTMMKTAWLVTLFVGFLAASALAAENRQLLQEEVEDIAPAAEGPLDETDADQDLITSAEAGEIDSVERALDEEANVTIADGFGWTALHYSAFAGSTKITQILLDRGADIEATSISSSRKRNVFTGEKSTPLHVAAAFGALDVVQLLLASGASANVRDLRGWTPLMRAARYGHADVVQALIDGGAEFDDPGNFSPLHLAAVLGLADVAEVLLNAGADIEATTRAGVTPLFAAAQYGRLEVAQLLINRGANKDAQDSGGSFPIDIICEKNRDCIPTVIAELEGLLA